MRSSFLRHAYSDSSQSVIAHHLVLNGYGTWLANDPRGSGSTEVRKPDLRQLGPVHHGRKARQPSRGELKAFHREAEPLLDFPVAWFDAISRDVIAATVERVVREQGWTCYAFAACSNHSHGMVRVHRDPGLAMWQLIADATRGALRDAECFAADHTVWSARPYVVFKTTVPAVERGIKYVEDNPEKEGLPRQEYDWVAPYDGWPLQRRR